jgi:hypothetical protein
MQVTVWDEFTRTFIVSDSPSFFNEYNAHIILMTNTGIMLAN